MPADLKTLGLRPAREAKTQAGGGQAAPKQMPQSAYLLVWLHWRSLAGSLDVAVRPHGATRRAAGRLQLLGKQVLQHAGVSSVVTTVDPRVNVQGNPAHVLLLLIEYTRQAEAE